jgi:ribosomal protein S18 acetylase RimI-like enzyme
VSVASLTLRAFAAGDDAVLISWFRSPDELWRFAGDSLRWPLDTRQLAAIRRDPETVAWTACIGHAEARRTSADAARLARVGLDPARRGEGLGRAMLRAVLDEVRALGLTSLDLRVYAGNDPARALYRGCGFRDRGEDPFDRRLRIMTLELAA